MNNKEFNKIVNEQLNYCKSLLIKKGEEYSLDNIDRLVNFKNGARIMGVSNMKCLLGYWTKHLTSILDMINAYETGETFTKERWNEKITDSINYLILLKALAYEDIEQVDRIKGVLNKFVPKDETNE